jgi:dephospho-CoA kinase
VGLTGGIACGKSTVSRLLSTKHHFAVIDADVLAREVVQPGTRAHAQIVRHFGEGILLKDGSRELDRKRLAGVIFPDEAKRKILNGIVHPAVQKAMLFSIIKCWLKGESVCVLDIPLLIEIDLWKLVGWVVVVYW